MCIAVVSGPLSLHIQYLVLYGGSSAMSGNEEVFSDLHYIDITLGEAVATLTQEKTLSHSLSLSLSLFLSIYYILLYRQSRVVFCGG